MSAGGDIGRYECKKCEGKGKVKEEETKKEKILESGRIKIWDWFSINMIWLKKYIDEDENTSWGNEDEEMVKTIKDIIENYKEINHGKEND